MKRSRRTRTRSSGGQQAVRVRLGDGERRTTVHVDLLRADADGVHVGGGDRVCVERSTRHCDLHVTMSRRRSVTSPRHPHGPASPDASTPASPATHTRFSQRIPAKPPRGFFGSIGLACSPLVSSRNEHAAARRAAAATQRRQAKAPRVSQDESRMRVGERCVKQTGRAPAPRRRDLGLRYAAFSAFSGPP